MILAHLALGYLVTKTINKVMPCSISTKVLMTLGLIGSVFPDFDMFYFYLVDRTIHHHDYWTHIPIMWLAILLIVGVLVRVIKPVYMPVLIVFGVNVVLHLVTDSIVGDIKWLYPFDNDYYALFTVPALYKPWWLNFILHWTFAVELTIIATALFIFVWENKRNKQQ